MARHPGQILKVIIEKPPFRIRIVKVNNVSCVLLQYEVKVNKCVLGIEGSIAESALSNLVTIQEAAVTMTSTNSSNLGEVKVRMMFFLFYVS